MPDLIQKAPTGRAKCRGCGRAIAAGALRFGEAGPNAFGEGESLGWFHLSCAALFRPEKLEPVLADEAASALVPEGEERAVLEVALREGGEHKRLPRLTRAERASSGRAHCRSCRELIPKGDWRFTLQLFEDGRPTPIGTIHASCALAYFGTANVLDRLARMAEPLPAPELESLANALATQRTPSAEELAGRDAAPEPGGGEAGGSGEAAPDTNAESASGAPGLAKAPGTGGTAVKPGVKRGA